MIDDQLRLRFNEKYEKHISGCWLWTASTAGKGYGQIKLPRQRKQIYAHRLAYEIFKGIKPGRKQVLHRCDTPRCVNPEHLFLGTCRDNLLDMKAKGRHLYGDRNLNHRLFEADVRQILVMLGVGLKQKQIAAAFGVSQITISRIKRGDRWAHVPRNT